MLPFFHAIGCVSKGRWRRVWIASLLISALAGLLYVSTISSSPFPGPSAQWIAWFSGADVRAVFERPLLYAAGHFFASLPLPGTLALRFNTLAAILGACVIGLLFRIAWTMTTGMAREQESISLVPRLARLSAWAASLCAIVTVPVWCASTRFTPAIVDAAFFLFCVNLLINYLSDGRLRWAILCAVLYAFGMAESYIFLYCFPGMLLLWVCAEMAVNAEGRFWHERTWSILVLAACSYFSGFIVAAKQAATFYQTSIDRDLLIDTIAGILRSQASEFSLLLPAKAWIFVLFTGIFFAFAAVCVSSYLLNNWRGRAALVLASVLSILGFYSLSHFGGTAWSVWAEFSRIPVFTSLMVSLGMGLLIAAWRAIVVMEIPVELEWMAEENKAAEALDIGVVLDEGHYQKPLNQVDASKIEPRMIRLGRALARFVLGMMVVGGIVVAFLNGSEFFRNKESCVAWVADDIIHRMGERSWIVGNDVLDVNLLLSAKEHNKQIILLSATRFRDKNYRKDLRSKLETHVTENVRLRTDALLNENFILYLEELFLNTPDITQKAIVLSAPDFWYGFKLEAVPEGFFYGGMASDTLGISRPGMTNEAVWSAFAQKVLAVKKGHEGLLGKIYHDALKRQVSMLVNNEGVRLDNAGDTASAFRLYTLSRRYNPDNVSALLNLYNLTVERNRVSKNKELIRSDLQRVLRDKTMRYPVWALSRYYGYVKDSNLFLQRGLAWVASSSPSTLYATLRNAQLREAEGAVAGQRVSLASILGALGDIIGSSKIFVETLVDDPNNRDAVIRYVNLLISQMDFGQAGNVLDAAERSGLTRSELRREWGTYYLAKGELNSARLLIDDPAIYARDPSLMLLLGIIMVEQGELVQVENVILPKLIKLTKGGDRFYGELLNGRLSHAKGEGFFEKARICISNAYLYRPNAHGLLEVILELDIALKDANSAEVHAIQLLRTRPNHGQANYVVGTLRLEKGLYADAEGYLESCAKGNHPMFEALNNYAEVLIRLGKLEQAESSVNRLLEIRPEGYEGWLLQADLCARSGKSGEASQALQKAQNILKTAGTDNPCLAFVEARILLAQQQPQAALHALSTLAAVKLNPAETKDLAELKHAVDKRTANEVNWRKP